MTSSKTILVAALLVVATIGAVPAAAQSSPTDDFTAEEESRVDQVLAMVGGIADRVTYRIFTDEDEINQTSAVSEDAKELRQSFNNNNSSTFQSYVNARFSGNATEWNVIKLRHVRGDASETQYIVADVNSTNGDFENASIVTDTDRTVDKTITLNDYASDQAAAEFDYFMAEYAEPDKDIRGKYVSRLASKYKGHIETDFEV